MGTLRDKIIPLTDDQREQRMESQAWNSVYGQPLNNGSGQQLVQNPPAQAPVKKSQTLYEMISSYGKPYDYTQEIKDAERNRKIGLFTDLAGLAGNLISGRRKFGDVPLASTQANAHLQRLKDLQRQGEVNYQNTLRSTKAQQYMLDKQDTIRGDENARRDRQYKDQVNYRNNQLQRQQHRDLLTDQRYKEQREDAREAREFSQGMQTKNYDRALRNDKETREYKNLMLVAKAGTNGNQTPKGMIDYYNPSTNVYYRVDEKRMNSFLPQIYSAIEKDAKSDPELERSLILMYNSNPSERREFVKQYWASSPSAVKLMEKIKDSSFNGKYEDKDKSNFFDSQSNSKSTNKPNFF